MLGVTVFGIFLTPVFCLVVDQVSHWSIFQFGANVRFLPALARILRFQRRPPQKPA
jgi:hypothetical protein